MNNKLICFAVAVLVFLPGCLHVPSYRSRPLRAIDSVFTYIKTDSGVTVRIGCLDDAAKSYLFNDRNIVVDGQNVEVIYLSVHNLTSNHYIISFDEIGLTVLSGADVVKLIQTNSANFLKKTAKVGGASYGIFGALPAVSFFIAAPYAASSCNGPLICLAMAKYLALFVGPAIAFVVALPFLGKAIKSAVMNGRINRDLKEKILSGDVVIKSGDKCDGLIFVRKADYMPQFSIAMREKNLKDKIVFDVNLATNVKSTPYFA